MAAWVAKLEDTSFDPNGFRILVGFYDAADVPRANRLWEEWIPVVGKPTNASIAQAIRDLGSRVRDSIATRDAFLAQVAIGTELNIP